MTIKPHSVLQGMAGAVLSLAIVAGAQTPGAPAPASTTAPDAPATPAAAPAAPVWSVGTVDFSGYVDGYYSYNANRPSNAANGQVSDFYNFDDKTDQFHLENAKLTLNHDPDPIGAHVDLLFGRANSVIHSSTDTSTDNFIEQAYLSVKPPKAKGFELDFGQFVTSAGAEVIETMNNWSYSHGLLFAWAIPYYHFGARTSVPVTKAWTAGFQLVNGWNNVANNNGGVTEGFTSSIVKPKYTWNAVYYTGPSNTDTQKGYKNLIDTELLLTPTPKFSAYINYDYGQSHASTLTPKASHSPHWQGVAVSARGQVTSNAALVARYEHFYDNQGFATGTGFSKQKMDEFTATYEYKWAAGLLMRTEYRRDWSNDAVYHKGDTKMVKAESTATVGLIAFFGPKR